MNEIEILEQYLKNTDLTIKELHDRNALSQIIQSMMAFRNEDGQHETIVIGTPLEIAKYAIFDGLEQEIEEIAMQISRYGYEMKKKGFEEGLKINSEYQ